MKLWRLNESTGEWLYERDVEPDTASEWLAVFQKHAPSATFRLANTRPPRKTQRRARRPSLVGRSAFVERYIPGAPVGVPSDALVEIREERKQRGAPTRVRISYRGNDYWTDEDNLRTGGAAARDRRPPALKRKRRDSVDVERQKRFTRLMQKGMTPLAAAKASRDPSRTSECHGKRYEIRAWIPNPRAKKRPGEIRVRTYWFCSNDPHYVLVELYRLRHEGPHHSLYGRWRFEVLDHGASGKHKLGEVVSYDELVRRSKSLVASDPRRRRPRR